MTLVGAVGIRLGGLGAPPRIAALAATVVVLATAVRQSAVAMALMLRAIEVADAAAQDDRPRPQLNGLRRRRIILPAQPTTLSSAMQSRRFARARDDRAAVGE